MLQFWTRWTRRPVIPDAHSLQRYVHTTAGCSRAVDLIPRWPEIIPGYRTVNRKRVAHPSGAKCIPYPWGHFVGEHSRLRDETRVAVNYKLLSRHGSQPRDTYWPGERPECGERERERESSPPFYRGEAQRPRVTRDMQRNPFQAKQGPRCSFIFIKWTSKYRKYDEKWRERERDRERERPRISQQRMVLSWDFLLLQKGFNKMYFLSLLVLSVVLAYVIY